MQYPKYIQDLINHFAQWPSVGPKTAERYVFYLLKKDNDYLKSLAKNISEIKQNINYCQECLALCAHNICPICQDVNRNKNEICVVENLQNLNLIEKTEQFKGYYFVLGGLINTLENNGPEKLPINKLKNIINKRQSKELLIGLNFSLEGESTALYLKKIFPQLKITRLARGLPSGSDLEYADQLTIANALKYKNTL